MRMSALLSLGLCTVLAACADAQTSPASAKHPLLGVHAPAFSRPGVVNASSVPSEQAKGKVVIGDFWATFCVPCEKEFPKLEELSQRYRGKLLVYGMSEDDSLEGIS